MAFRKLVASSYWDCSHLSKVADQRTDDFLVRGTLLDVFLARETDEIFLEKNIARKGISFSYVVHADKLSVTILSRHCLGRNWHAIQARPQYIII